MYILRDFQENAVQEMLTHTYDALAEAQAQVPILLEAPTGSGKTVMMSDYLYRLVDELKLQPGGSNNVAFVWFAPNTLHLQSYKSLQALYEDTQKLNCINLSNLSANPVLNPHDLLFVNWASLSSETNIWRKENENNANLESLIENTHLNDTKIILIIDEAHLSGFTGPQAISVRNLIAADVEVLVTATPTNAIRAQRSVYISRAKVIEQEMIKKGVRLNIDLDPSQQGDDNVHIHLLRTALAKREELKKSYEDELGVGKVNPLLLIQLPSENTGMSAEDKGIRELLENLLESQFDITQKNGKLAVWLSGEKDTNHLEAINGVQEVLIFKQAIAQGWDCPRAAVMVSYRNVQSSAFGIQTVGRILRMPHIKHYDNDELNYGYVYTNLQMTRVNFVPDDLDYVNCNVAFRVKGNAYDVITSATMVNDRAAKGVLTSAFESQFFNVMEQRFDVKQLPDTDLFTEADIKDLDEQRKKNKDKMAEQGWAFDIDDHQIAIPVNMEIDPYIVNSIRVDAEHTKQFAITTAQFNTMFEQMCFDNITRLNKSKSYKKLRDVLICFAEYYLGMDEYKARRFFLFANNRGIVEPIIIEALEYFESYQQNKGNDRRRVENKDWEVPEHRYYNDLYNEQNLDKHALEPFYEYDNASLPEVSFKELLEQNAEHIEWWYKNGDAGKEHFAVPYDRPISETSTVKSLFYVDFVIKFKSGTIGLFDTKTRRSDYDAPAKHNGLLDYMEENNANSDTPMIGGVIIEERPGRRDFRFCTNRIDDTDDLMGWTFFNPRDINNQ